MQKEPIFSFKGGMETLIKGLTDTLEGNIHYNSPATSLTIHPEGIEVGIGDQRLFADRVISTLPTQTVSNLLQIHSPCQSAASVAVIALGFNQQHLKHKGFGYLVPSKENENILGMVWDSTTFPSQNTHSHQTRLTVMVDAQSPKDFKNTALDALARHLHIEAQPDVLEVKIATNAIPHYSIGHKEQTTNFIHQCKALSPNLSLLGTAFHGVAVNDCIAQVFSMMEGEI